MRSVVVSPQTLPCQLPHLRSMQARAPEPPLGGPGGGEGISIALLISCLSQPSYT
ncbi:MAG: hypothetical protein JNK82_14150 [Myxococcaceae bacterium]|nr:hypothetical protein [Myxococcaceae bacterium]